MSKYTYILDPGHGGIINGKYVTPGKRSPKWNDREFDDGTPYVLYEGVNNRDNVRRIENALKQKGIDCINIVDTEQDIGINKRVALANEEAKKKKCIFISIHSNAAGNGRDWAQGHGNEVLIGTNASSESKFVAKKFKECMAESFSGLAKQRKTLVTDQVGVVYRVKCPSVLLEFGFHDNKVEAKKMLTDEWKEKLVESVLNAVDFFEKYGLNEPEINEHSTPSDSESSPTNYIFTAERGKVKCSSKTGVYVRKQPNTDDEHLQLISYQEIVDVTGFVSNGLNVSGNSKWFKTTEGNYIWSGALESTENGAFEYDFVEYECKIKVTANSGLYRRRTPTSKGASVDVVTYNSVVNITGYVKNGESVQNVKKWYKDEEGNFLWSKPTEEILKAENPNPEQTKNQEEETSSPDTTIDLNEKISGSVGPGCVNEKSDVELVQKLLKSKGLKLEVDGSFGDGTTRAVKLFQKSVFNWSRGDGKVDVGGQTWKALIDSAISYTPPSPISVYINDTQKKKRIEAILNEARKSGIKDNMSLAAILSIVSKESGFDLKFETSWFHTDTSRIISKWSGRLKLNGYNESIQSIDNLKKQGKEEFDKYFFSAIYGKAYGNDGYSGRSGESGWKKDSKYDGPYTDGLDGWRYRGAGYNQITFKSNFIQAQEGSGIKDLLDKPLKIIEEGTAEVVCIGYFTKRKKGMAKVQKNYGTIDGSSFDTLENAVLYYYHANAGTGKTVKYIKGLLLNDPLGGMTKAQERAPYFLEHIESGEN